MTAASAGPPPRRSGPALPRTVAIFIAGLGMIAVGLAALAASLDDATEAHVVALVPFVALLVGAEYFFVRFRYRGQINALNLFEAVLVPMLFAYPGPVVVAAVAVAQVLGGTLRRNAPMKAAFNVAQWAAAAAAGSAVLAALRDGPMVSAGNIAALTLAMVVVGVVNQVSFTTVIWLAVDPQPLRRLLSDLGPVILPGWGIGWIVNTLVGLLFALAFASASAAVLLFVVPLVVLHAAYRGFASSRSDRARLAGLHRASRLLAEPLDPDEAIGAYLGEVCRCFEAQAAELVLRRPDGLSVHRVTGTDASTYVREIDTGTRATLRSTLLGRQQAVRITDSGSNVLAGLLRAEGWRDCLAAPLDVSEVPEGMLLVYDQAGLEGFEEGERAVLEALARETAGIFEKGELLRAILDERRKLSEIVDSTSDGILTIASDGTIRSWNPALERITGRFSSEMEGRRSLDVLRPRNTAGAPVSLERWAQTSTPLPQDVQVTGANGETRWLSCSYSYASGDEGEARLLVVVARDATKVREIELLKEEFGRLVEREAAQREMVHRLEESVRPPTPEVEGAELGVYYLPSDSSAPTGGDLYDWQMLPGGDLHVAVVDVLGAGVAATKDALSVIHALRLLALDEFPLEGLVAKAHELVTAQNPDLVATVLVGRYSPRDGTMRLAGGGHPPAFHVGADDSVAEVFAPGGALGWPGAGSEEIVELRLEPSETLVLYTDGLVEARKDILEGMDALARTASETNGYPVQKLARALVERSLAGAARRDDSLALVLRRARPVTAEFAFVLPSGLDKVTAARRRLGEWLTDRGVTAECVADLTLVASELLTNAVRAARSHVEIRAALRSLGAVIEVEDDGVGLDPALSRPSRPPDDEAEQGRGLYLVQVLADEVAVFSDPDGTVVRCTKDGVLPAPATQSAAAAS